VKVERWLAEAGIDGDRRRVRGVGVAQRRKLLEFTTAA
jgi:hypothetical protein